MSFFEKLNQEKFSLYESIINQIGILFSNKIDNYWAFDYRTRKIFPIHDVFHLNYFSPEFSEKLAQAIEVFEPRISNVQVFVYEQNSEICVSINAFLVQNNELLDPIVMRLS